MSGVLQFADREAFRRWLEACNPELTALIDGCITTRWRRDPGRLVGLMEYMDNDRVLEQLERVAARYMKLFVGCGFKSLEVLQTLC